MPRLESVSVNQDIILLDAPNPVDSVSLDKTAWRNANIAPGGVILKRESVSVPVLLVDGVPTVINVSLLTIDSSSIQIVLSCLCFS